MGGTYSAEQRDQIAQEMSHAELQSLIKSTRYNAEEILHLRSQFMSDIPSGVVTQQMFSIAASYFGITEPLLIEMLFRAFDANEDGMITFFEFARGMSIMTRGSNSERVLFAFDMYDVQRTGTLTLEGMMPLLEAMERCFGSFILYEDAQTKLQQAQLRVGAMDVGRRLFEKSPQLTRDGFRELAVRMPSIVRGLALQV